MPNCGPPGCTNRSTTHPEKSFHRLPSISKKRMKEPCIAKINRKLLPKELFICSDHFKPECFKRDQVRLGLIFLKKLFPPF